MVKAKAVIGKRAACPSGPATVEDGWLGGGGVYSPDPGSEKSVARGAHQKAPPQSRVPPTRRLLDAAAGAATDLSATGGDLAVLAPSARVPQPQLPTAVISPGLFSFVSVTSSTAIPRSSAPDHVRARSSAPGHVRERRGTASPCWACSAAAPRVPATPSSYLTRRGSSYLTRRGSSYLTRRGSSYLTRRG